MPGPRNMRKGEKPKNFKKAILRLFTFNKKYVPFIVIALILSGVSINAVVRR